MTNRLTILLALVSLTLSGCHQAAPASGVEPATLNLTDWTETTELYMEYPPLVAGRTARFAVHLTRLGDFQPVNAGHAVLEFVGDAGGSPTTIAGPEPSRPGAFRVEGMVPRAGRYRWALVLQSPNLADRHDLGMVTVFPDDH